MLLNNKTAIITGCSRGIGFATLKHLSLKLDKIFACVRKIDDSFISALSNFDNKNIIPIEFDLNDRDQIKIALDQIKSKAESIDMLVNNAATIDTALFQMTPDKKIKNIFEINFFSQVYFTQQIVKLMLKKKSGSIVFVSSTSSLDGDFGRGSYASSKSALNSISKVMSRELGNFNIRVNSIAPGLTNTDMAIKNTKKEIIDDVVSKTSLKRIAKPEAIAKVISFLLSDDASYITGQTIRVDGGS